MFGGAIAGSISTSSGLRKLRQLKPSVPIWSPHHHDVDLDTCEPVDAVHQGALDAHFAFARYSERGEKSNCGCKVVGDDADVVQSLDRHVAEAVRGGPGRPLSRVGRGQRGNYSHIRLSAKKAALDRLGESAKAGSIKATR